MSNPIVYVGGDIGNIGYVDLVTLDYTPLPSIPSTKTVHSIQVIAPDDIWVGVRSDLNDKPSMAYWNGVSWTEYDISSVLSGNAWRWIVSIKKLGDTFYIACEGSVQGGPWGSRLYKATVPGSFTYIGQLWCGAHHAPIWGSEDDVYIGTNRTDSPLFRYTGTSWGGSPVLDTDYTVPVASNNGCYGGCRKSDGTNFFLSRNGSFMRQSNGFTSWALEKTINSTSDSTPNLWLDSITDDIWIIEYLGSTPDCNVWTWDGTTWSYEYMALNHPSIGGYPLSTGSYVVIVEANPGTNFHVRNPSTGLWASRSLSYNIQEINPYILPDETPPVIDELDPASGATEVSSNTAISFNVTDETAVDSSATEIYINGVKVWENDAALSGWIGSYTAITDGYHYTIQPPGILSPGSTVTVQVNAADTSGNPATEIWSFTIAAEVGIPKSIKWLENIDFPFRFLSDADVVLTTDDKAINDNIKLAVFVRRNGFPLVPIGFGIEESVFDNLDEGFKAYIALRVQEAIILGVESVQPSKDLVFIETDNKVSVSVPYANTKVRKFADTILAVPKEPTD